MPVEFFGFASGFRGRKGGGGVSADAGQRDDRKSRVEEASTDECSDVRETGDGEGGPTRL